MQLGAAFKSLRLCSPLPPLPRHFFNPVISHGGEGSLLGPFTHSLNRLCQNVYLCQACANLIAHGNKMISIVLPQRLPNQAVKTEK